MLLRPFGPRHCILVDTYSARILYVERYGVTVDIALFEQSSDQAVKLATNQKQAVRLKAPTTS